MYFAVSSPREIGGTLRMRSHISVHRATAKYFSNSFIFKNKIEKEGLPQLARWVSTEKRACVDWPADLPSGWRTGSYSEMGSERFSKSVESGYNKGTIRSDIRYLVVSKDVRRCHGRGREFESRRPRHSFQTICDKQYEHSDPHFLIRRKRVALLYKISRFCSGESAGSF
jgi:hypothetical protein